MEYILAASIFLEDGLQPVMLTDVAEIFNNKHPLEEIDLELTGVCYKGEHVSIIFKYVENDKRPSWCRIFIECENVSDVIVNHSLLGDLFKTFKKSRCLVEGFALLEYIGYRNILLSIPHVNFVLPKVPELWLVLEASSISRKKLIELQDQLHARTEDLQSERDKYRAHEDFKKRLSELLPSDNEVIVSIHDDEHFCVTVFWAPEPPIGQILFCNVVHPNSRLFGEEDLYFVYADVRTKLLKSLGSIVYGWKTFKQEECSWKSTSKEE